MVAGDKRRQLQDEGMKAPLISVLIDTYNYGQYVEEAVESVLAQDFPVEEREILVVDDGSTDDTAERLQKFRESIHYLRKPNGGQASAFNYGFERARGEIIALLDADDTWLPDKLRRVREAFQANPEAGMVYHRVYLWEEGKETSIDPYFVPVSGRVTENRGALLSYPMTGTSSLAFRKSALDFLLPVPEELKSQADAYLTALIIFVAKVEAIPEFLGTYRLHGANLFQANGQKAPRAQIVNRMAMREILLKEVERWLTERGHDLHDADLGAYIQQWRKAQERDRFLLDAPSRWTFFRHLLEYPRLYGDLMKARHQLYSYVQAFGALFLGYRHFHILEDTRSSYKRVVGPSNKVTRVGEEKTSSAKG
jgi:glycosyltransferase involved in cell wall biosynthesis